MNAKKLKFKPKKWMLYIIGVFVLIGVIIVGLNMKSRKFSPVKGLEVEVTHEASGKEIHKGQVAKVHYTGWLKDGTKFDSSKDRNEPFDFIVGDGQVIRGWDLGVEGMKVGETRKLTIASDLGYGAGGAGNVIPPNATLLFEVELLGIGE